MAKRSAPAIRTSFRCAVYTRKSTEEGLDQAFNSLDAQREACDAYITSQRHEAWVAVKERYDDGGCSGGNMERPGLKRLLADIEAGKVDVIVVYKVDRLTRALSDFAKIVEILDARGASFVSITQSFNTTTSMGRLTLNVLLSFAQFEREVTGERIRDKIAQSKAKGMWMGGSPPLGYDVCDRTLVINQAEAETVRHVMRRYVALRSGSALVQELRAGPHRTKLHRGRGGIPFRLGAVYYLLSNQTYIGKVVHRGAVHDGEHPPLIDIGLWEQVQAIRSAGRDDAGPSHRNPHRSLLTGRITDAEGRPMTPSHAVKGQRRYRYYVTHHQALADGGSPAARIAAPDLEDAVVSRIAKLLNDRTSIVALMPTIDAAGLGHAYDRAAKLSRDLQQAATRYTIVRDLVARVTLASDVFHIELDRAHLLRSLDIADQNGVDETDPILLTVRATRIRQHKDVRLVIGNERNESDGVCNGPLVALLAEARAAYDDALAYPERSIAETAAATGRCRKRLAKLMRIALLAPDIIDRCIAGTQPVALTTVALLSADLPMAWTEQKKLTLT